VRMLIILGGVVLVIYLFFFFLKKGMKKKMPENDIMRVITSTRLQGNDIIYLIQTGYHYFLVGSGGNGLSLIAQITDKETIDTIMLNTNEEKNPGKQNFSDILLKIFKPGKKQNGLISNPLNFMKKQQERLNKLK
jgi:flagellar biogenesis protein FliO